MNSKKVIFIFIDGIGLGARDNTNPFNQASMPFLNNLIGRPLTKGPMVQEANLLLKGIDACLDVDGIPQSATGQTSLFTGQNASKVLGYHLPAFPNEPLIELIEKYSILKQVTEKGGRATFANAYTPHYFELVEQGKRDHSATTLCVLAAKLNFRYLDQLSQGEAVYWDMTNEILHQNRYSVPKIPAKKAGQHLAYLSQCHELVLFECFLSDLIGHRKDWDRALHFLEQLDGFIEGVVEGRESQTSIVMTSDHGNLEDLSTGAHTRNHVPLLVLGPFADHATQLNSILDVTPSIISYCF